MRDACRLPLIVVALTGLGAVAGCSDPPPPPGSMTWSVRHDGALHAGTNFDNDMMGSLYVCLFDKDPFLPENKAKVKAYLVGDSVNLQAPDSMIASTNDSDTFTLLPAGSHYTLVIFLDDDNNNATKLCVDGKGAPAVSEKDPLFVVDTPDVVTQMTVDVPGVFDHRFSERIR